MGNPAIRGHQGRIKVLLNGQPANIFNITNFESNQDSDFQRSKYVGNAIPEGDQIENGWSGSIDLEVKDGSADDLVDALISTNLAGIGGDEALLIEDEYYTNGVIRSYVYYDVQYKLSKRKPANEKQTKRLDWQASGRQKL